MRAAVIAAVMLVSVASYAGNLSGGGASGASDTRRPPNVLIITLDDMDWTNMKALGRGPDNLEMPNVDALAERGIAFPNAHGGLACTPTRTMLLTSRFPFANGEGGSPTTWDAGNRAVFEAARLAHPGGFTFGAGKYGGMTDEGAPSDRAGVDRWLGRGANLVDYANLSTADQSDYKRDRVPQVISVDVPDGYYANLQLLDDWKDLVDEYRTGHAGAPLVAWLSLNSPHFGSGLTYHRPSEGSPWNSCSIGDDTINGTYFCKEAYREMVEDDPLGADWVIGEALSYLTEAEVANLCIFTMTDNGGSGYWSAPVDRVKGTNYGEATHIGMIVSGEACVPKSNHGTSGAAGIMVVDIGPTIAELTGITLVPGGAIHGSSFASLLAADCRSGACDDMPGRTIVYGSELPGNVRVHYEDLRRSLVIAKDGSWSELYSYDTDPYEQNDLCGGDCSTASLSGAEDADCQGLVDYLDALGVLSSPILCGGS